MTQQEFGWRAWLLLAFTGFVLAAVVLMPPTPQPIAYHAFADRRSVLGIPAFLNVVSNVPFLLAGLYGLAVLHGPARDAFVDSRERTAYVVFFCGAMLTAFGSAWYHAAPDNVRLVSDRLPMTLGFAGFAAAVLAERFSPEWGRRALWPLVLVGAGTVLFWHATEQAGRGDVIPYAAYQGWTVAVVLFAFAACPARRYSHGAALGWVVALYAAAKLAEGFDDVIYRSGNIVSGHTLKHLLAAGAVLVVAGMLQRRSRPSAARAGAQESTA
jgi:hypothetical protein